MSALRLIVIGAGRTELHHVDRVLLHLGEHRVDRGPHRSCPSRTSGCAPPRRRSGRRKPTAEPTPALPESARRRCRASRPVARHARARHRRRRSGCDPPARRRARPAWTPGGVRHVLFDDLGNAEGRQRDVEVERRADMALDGGSAQRRVEAIVPPANLSGSMRPSTTLASVTAGGAAQPIAGWAGIGTGAFRSDGDAFHGVDARQRAAAGADLDHLDHGDAPAGRCPS